MEWVKYKRWVEFICTSAPSRRCLKTDTDGAPLVPHHCTSAMLGLPTRLAVSLTAASEQCAADLSFFFSCFLCVVFNSFFKHWRAIGCVFLDLYCLCNVLYAVPINIHPNLHSVSTVFNNKLFVVQNVWQVDKKSRNIFPVDSDSRSYWATSAVATKCAPLFLDQKHKPFHRFFGGMFLLHKWTWDYWYDGLGGSDGSMLRRQCSAPHEQSLQFLLTRTIPRQILCVQCQLILIWISLWNHTLLHSSQWTTLPGGRRRVDMGVALSVCIHI